MISFCHLKTLVPSCLQKKRLENTFLTLIVNYCKIIQKNKLRHSKKQSIGYLIICNVIYSLLILIEKLPFFNKHLDRFIISLMLQNIRYLDNVTVWKHHHFSQNYKSHQDGENNDPKIRSRCTLQWNKTYEISVLSKFGI